MELVDESAGGVGVVGGLAVVGVLCVAVDAAGSGVVVVVGFCGLLIGISSTGGRASVSGEVSTGGVAVGIGASLLLLAVSTSNASCSAIEGRPALGTSPSPLLLSWSAENISRISNVELPCEGGEEERTPIMGAGAFGIFGLGVSLETRSATVSFSMFWEIVSSKTSRSRYEGGSPACTGIPASSTGLPISDSSDERATPTVRIEDLAFSGAEPYKITVTT